MTGKDQEIIKAVSTNNTCLVRVLLCQGHNPNAIDRYGNSLLFKAVINNSLELVEDLIDQGADINYIDGRGFGILMIAVECCNTTLFTYLLNHGANTTIRNCSVLDFTMKLMEHVTPYNNMDIIAIEKQQILHNIIKLLIKN